MIECIIGSVIGTLLGLPGSFFIVRYQLEKDWKRQIKEIEGLIEELTTFKITIKDEIFGKS